MYNLRIKLNLKDHPYKTAPGAYSEAWGSISVNIHDGENVSSLVQTEWDILCLSEWFIDNRAVIAVENFLMLGEKATSGESISEAMRRIRVQKFSLPFQKPENIIEEEMAIYEDYYSRHSPYRDMIGSGMPEILIGLNNGIGEISLLSKTEKWVYQFDMGEFIEDFSNEIRQFISEWLSMTENPDAQQRGLKIVNSL